MRQKSSTDLINQPYAITLIPYEDGGYFARIEDLPGCSTEGDSLADALEMIEDAKELWIETAVERGLKVPMPSHEREYNGRILLRIPPSFHEALVHSARREGVSLNQYLVYALAQGSCVLDMTRVIRTVVKDVWDAMVIPTERPEVVAERRPFLRAAKAVGGA